MYRTGPNQQQLSVGRTKASLIHVKSPGVSEKHAEVSTSIYHKLFLSLSLSLQVLTDFCFFLETDWLLLPANQVVWIPDKTAWGIRDVGSSNGTVVNGEQLNPEVITRPLKDGDRIKLGLQSELLIQVVEIPDENMTVEQYLNKECDRLISTIRVSE